LPFITRETVARETPAARATSSIVVARVPLWVRANPVLLRDLVLALSGQLDKPTTVLAQLGCAAPE